MTCCQLGLHSQTPSKKNTQTEHSVEPGSCLRRPGHQVSLEVNSHPNITVNRVLSRSLCEEKIAVQQLSCMASMPRRLLLKGMKCLLQNGRDRNLEARVPCRHCTQDSQVDYSPGTSHIPQPRACTTDADRDFEGTSVAWETGREQWNFFHCGPGNNHASAPWDLGFGLPPWLASDKLFPPVARQMSAFLPSRVLASGNRAALTTGIPYLFTFCISLIFFPLQVYVYALSFLVWKQTMNTLRGRARGHRVAGNQFPCKTTSIGYSESCLQGLRFQQRSL